MADPISLVGYGLLAMGALIPSIFTAAKVSGASDENKQIETMKTDISSSLKSIEDSRVNAAINLVYISDIKRRILDDTQRNVAETFQKYQVGIIDPVVSKFLSESIELYNSDIVKNLEKAKQLKTGFEAKYEELKSLKSKVSLEAQNLPDSEDTLKKAGMTDAGLTIPKSGLYQLLFFSQDIALAASQAEDAAKTINTMWQRLLFMVKDTVGKSFKEMNPPANPISDAAKISGETRKFTPGVVSCQEAMERMKDFVNGISLLTDGSGDPKDSIKEAIEILAGVGESIVEDDFKDISKFQDIVNKLRESSINYMGTQTITRFEKFEKNVRNMKDDADADLKAEMETYAKFFKASQKNEITTATTNASNSMNKIKELSINLDNTASSDSTNITECRKVILDATRLYEDLVRTRNRLKTIRSSLSAKEALIVGKYGKEVEEGKDDLPEFSTDANDTADDIVKKLEKMKAWMETSEERAKNFFNRSVYAHFAIAYMAHFMNIVDFSGTKVLNIVDFLRTKMNMFTNQIIDQHKIEYSASEYDAIIQIRESTQYVSNMNDFTYKIQSQKTNIEELRKIFNAYNNQNYWSWLNLRRRLKSIRDDCVASETKLKEYQNTLGGFVWQKENTFGFVSNTKEINGKKTVYGLLSESLPTGKTIDDLDGVFEGVIQGFATDYKNTISDVLESYTLSTIIPSIKAIRQYFVLSGDKVFLDNLKKIYEKMNIKRPGMSGKGRFDDSDNSEDEDSIFGGDGASGKPESKASKDPKNDAIIKEFRKTVKTYFDTLFTGIKSKQYKDKVLSKFPKPSYLKKSIQEIYNNIDGLVEEDYV